MSTAVGEKRGGRGLFTGISEYVHRKREAMHSLTPTFLDEMVRDVMDLNAKIHVGGKFSRAHFEKLFHVDTLRLADSYLPKNKPVPYLNRNVTSDTFRIQRVSTMLNHPDGTAQKAATFQVAKYIPGDTKGTYKMDVLLELITPVMHGLPIGINESSVVRLHKGGELIAELTLPPSANFDGFHYFGEGASQHTMHVNGGEHKTGNIKPQTTDIIGRPLQDQKIPERVAARRGW